MTSSPVPAPPPVSIPYARFALSLLLVIGAAFTVAFLTLNDIVRRRADLILVFVLSVIALVMGIWAARKWWSRIGRLAEQDSLILWRRRTILRQAIFFTILVTVAGGVLGVLIASNGMEEGNFKQDLDQYDTLSQRISAARTAPTVTVDDDLAIYEIIERDVNSLKGLLERLTLEADVHDRKFPEHHETTQTTKNNLENSSKEVAFILQQIAVAKDIRTLPTTDERINAWDQKMRPLISAENQLPGNN